MHFYSFNIGDYRRRTNHLSLLEHGIYRALLDTYYLEEMPLNLDIERLARQHCVRNDEEMIALKYVLDEFFEKTSEGYEQSACNEVIAKYSEKSKKAKESAKKRWNNANAYANASETQCERICERNANGMLTNNQEPITKNQEPRTNVLKDISPTLPSNSKKQNDEIKQIFDHWRAVMKKNSPKLSQDRKSKIKARLDEGFSIDQIKQAVSGCVLSDWHMGRNEKTEGKKYNDITLICRSAKYLENFIELAEDYDGRTFEEKQKESEIISMAEELKKRNPNSRVN